MVRPSIQIEKKIAFMPPSRMRGISMCPSGLRLPRSKFLEKNRCVVSSCVSRTIEEKWSLRARSAMSSPNVTCNGMLRTNSDRTRAANRRATRIHSSTEIWQEEFNLRALPPQPVVRVSTQEPAEQSLLPRRAIHFGYRFGERNSFRACLHAILRVRTILNAAFLHESVQAFLGMHRASWMHVEEPHLADDGCAHELAVGIHLRANF